MERELTERMAQLRDQLAVQLAAYEKERRQFDEDRALWEAENREALTVSHSHFVSTMQIKNLSGITASQIFLFTLSAMLGCSL
ncbi:hypothetical protein FBUS_11662 [Fasciolopsis buskii]|uniref:Uncharacterized protein n=1 Tax=Fasciolopsis buskii TaxID=27845 RepID=A0A8E0S3N2_9TREM|nr:hypothetical protein FBUS_11662 [Fasciolopsis buski]